MIKYDFIKVITQILKLANDLRLIHKENDVRKTFKILFLILISYADDNYEFRENAAQSDLVTVLLKIISDNPVEQSNDLCTECVNGCIRGLFNITRVESEIIRFKKLGILDVLSKRFGKTNDSKTRLCLIACVLFNLYKEEFNKNEFLIDEVTLKEELIFAFNLIIGALKSGNNNDRYSFCCYLGEPKKLPYFWADFIVKIIAQLAENKNSIRVYVESNPELLNCLFELHTRGNLEEKGSTQRAIEMFFKNENISNHFLKQKEYVNFWLTNFATNQSYEYKTCMVNIMQHLTNDSNRGLVQQIKFYMCLARTMLKEKNSKKRPKNLELKEKPNKNNL